jgi:hypothetical protein
VQLLLEGLVLGLQGFHQLCFFSYFLWVEAFPLFHQFLFKFVGHFIDFVIKVFVEVTDDVLLFFNKLLVTCNLLLHLSALFLGFVVCFAEEL